MEKLLNLVPIGTIEKSDQKVGNCTFASAKGGFHALLLLTLLNKKGFDPDKIIPTLTQNKTYLGDPREKIDASTIKKTDIKDVHALEEFDKWNSALPEAVKIFKQWEVYNRRQALLFLMSDSMEEVVGNNKPIKPRDHFSFLSEVAIN